MADNPRCKRCEERAVIRTTLIVELLPPKPPEATHTTDVLCLECINDLLTIWGQWMGDESPFN